jgi:hypothetical protein
MKMKSSTIKMAIALVSLVSVAGMTSCKKKGCTDPNAVNYSDKAKVDDNSCKFADGNGATPNSQNDTIINGVSYVYISGTYTESLNFSSANKYLMSGGVSIENNANLTIAAGTQIYAADDNSTVFLAIQRGSKIFAEGSENNPIVFTTIKSNPQPGDWGGIVINGRAPINNGTDPVGEGQTGQYGGTVVNDNSGIMRYVRVEWAGKQITADVELNGFSFYGVGSGTVLDHLQAFQCADDGFEFFGGTANLTNALSFGAGDDSFDWTYGWSGTGSNWKAMQTPGGDRGLEGDNNGSNNTASPYSNPTLNNIHLVGNGSADGKSGAKLREGMKATITNLLIEGFAKGLDVEHDVTLNNVIAGTLSVSQASTVDVTTSVVFKGSKDASGNEINPQLKTDAANSGNVVVDGQATVTGAWITGTWYRNL